MWKGSWESSGARDRLRRIVSWRLGVRLRDEAVGGVRLPGRGEWEGDDWEGGGG